MAKSRDERAGHQSCFIQQVHLMKAIIWCCFAAAVDVEESEEKAHKRKRMILSWISFRISWIGHFFMFLSGLSISPLRLWWLVNTRYQASKIGSALFHTLQVSDTRRQRKERAAEQHKPCSLIILSGEGSRILYWLWRTARKPSLQHLACNGPNG